MSKALQIARLAALTTSRQFSRSATQRADNVPEGYRRLKQIQEKFQVNDGNPIHLKGGFGDKALYQITFVLCLVGCAGILKLFYDLSVPKKE